MIIPKIPLPAKVLVSIKTVAVELQEGGLGKGPGKFLYKGIQISAVKAPTKPPDNPPDILLIPRPVRNDFMQNQILGRTDAEGYAIHPFPLRPANRPTFIRQFCKDKIDPDSVRIQKGKNVRPADKGMGLCNSGTKSCFLERRNEGGDLAFLDFNRDINVKGGAGDAPKKVGHSPNHHIRNSPAFQKPGQLD